MKEEKVCVPKNEVLRVEIIQLHHDVLVAGDGRKWKMMELVMRNYWWLEVTKDIEKYVEGYDICQRIKNKIKIPVGNLKLSKVPEKPWTHLTVNFIMKLPIVARKDTILVVCDKLSKMIYLVTTTEGTLVEELARLLRDNVWKLHGLLKSIVSDRGS